MIGDAFPVDDPVARFLTVVAMISNDWQRLAQQMSDLDDQQVHGEEQRAEHGALLVANYRLQAALHYEAAHALKLACESFHEIRAFIDQLPAQAVEEYKFVIDGIDGIDADSPDYHGRWLSEARNATFHYSKLNRRERVGQGLRAVASDMGVISDDGTFASVRFGFADKVALEWIGGSQPQGELATQMTALSESVLAMTRFAQRAMSVYLASRGIELLAPIVQ
jgi:hypothetical protein